MLRILRSFALLALLGLSSACSNDGQGDNKTNLRFINAVPDVRSVNFIIDFDIFFEDVDYLVSSGYFDIDTNPHLFQVTPSNSLTTLAENRTSLSSNSDFTFIAYGPSEQPADLLLRDNNEPAGDSSFKLRPVNVASSFRPVDLYVTTEPSSISRTAPAEENFGYRSVGNYLVGQSGAYFVVAADARTGRVLKTSTAQNFEGRGVYTVLLADSPGAEGAMKIIILEDAKG
jgi:hypothetical protein